MNENQLNTNITFNCISTNVPRHYSTSLIVSFKFTVILVTTEYIMYKITKIFFHCYLFVTNKKKI